MKKIVKAFEISVLVFLAIAFFAACKKDETPKPVPEEGDFSTNNSIQQIMVRTNGQADEGLCFDLVFPLTVDLPDGTTLSANTMEALENIYNDWFQNNPADSTCPALVYPMNVVLEDGTPQTISSEEQFIALLETCFDIDLGWEDCFQIQYPVTVAYPDGSSSIVNSDQAMMDAMETWSENHPHDSLYPTLAYPIYVVKADGSTVAIQNDDELSFLFEDCFEAWEPEEPTILCFEYVFPLQVALPDGTTATANSYVELDQIFIDWFENHPNDTTSFPSIAYPVNLQMEDSSIVTVNNDDEFYAVFDDCFGDGNGGGGFEECFTFNYPLSLVLPDGSTPAVNNDEELWTAVFDWYENHPEDSSEVTFQYPISITLTANGTVVSIQNDDQLDAILEGCFECVVGNGDGLVLGNKKSAAAKMAVTQHAKIKAKTKARNAKILSKKAHALERF